MYQSIKYYAGWYRDYALDSWNNMGPAEYGMVLVSIGVFGWILMKNTGRR